MSRLIPVANIERHPDADLFPHDEEHVQRLSEDVKARGIQTPLHVYPLANDRFLLLAGHDRLEAAKRAGLAEVPADMRSMLSTDEARFEYFVKDNTIRKDIDKRAVALAVLLKHPDWSNYRIAELAGVGEATARRAREEAEAKGLVRQVTHVEDSAGRQQPAKKPAAPKVKDNNLDFPKPASKADQLRQMREEQFSDHRETPFGHYIPDTRAIPANERTRVGTLLDQPGIPKDTADRIVANLAAMPEAERENIYALNESDDAEKRTLALTRAAGMPAMPSAAAMLMEAAIEKVEAAAAKHPDREDYLDDMAGVCASLRHWIDTLNNEREAA